MSTTDKVLIKELYPLVEKGLSKKQNRESLKRAITDFLDRNTEKLTAIGPSQIIIFSDKDSESLFKAIEVDPDTISAIIKKASHIKSHWETMRRPFNSGCAMAIRYFTLNKDEEMVQLTLVYFTMFMYPLLHKKFFKYGANEQIMNYTINNLSNKYKIKQSGTLFAALLDTTKVCYATNKKKIESGTDKEIVDYINDERTRLNMLLRNIANEYFENHKKQLYLNTEIDRFDEDNYREADSNTFAIERITNNVVLKMVVDGPNIKYVTLAAKLSQVSVNELRNYVNQMVTSEKREDIKKIVENILFLYIFDSQNSIQEVNSNKFLMYCVETYKKSNTTNKNIIEIKKILDEWLEDLGTYKKTQRLATINNFRRALFLVFIISIQMTH